MKKKKQCSWCLGWGGWDDADSNGMFWNKCGCCNGTGNEPLKENKNG